MYAAKQTGSVYAIYNAKHDQHSPRRLSLSWASCDRPSTTTNCSFTTSQRSIFEPAEPTVSKRFVRWQHPQYGFIPPDQFIGPAEQTGLIEPFTRWVLNTAIQQCETWHRAALSLTVSAKPGGQELHNPQPGPGRRSAPKITALRPITLVLEITESAIMVDPMHAMNSHPLKQPWGRGFPSMTFGTGYSSLGYLKSGCRCMIKIDKSFVMVSGANEDDTVLVISIINLAHNLGLKVVAEGVENQLIGDQLTAFDCDAAQDISGAGRCPRQTLPDGWASRRGALRQIRGLLIHGADNGTVTVTYD
jgi:EAL domain-containing protein (putative c-di-GMP-specific phosphodiesterase class I)